MANVIPSTRRASLADWEAMPHEDAGARYELFHGRIYVTPTPITQHQRISIRLLRLLDRGLPPGHELFFPPTAVELTDEQMAQPDLLVIADEYVGEKWVTGPPLLVVEVISPSTKRRDLGFKKDAYAASGVQHYWVVDAKADRVLAYRLTDDATYEVVLDQTGGVVELAEPIPVSFTLADLARVR